MHQSECLAKGGFKINGLPKNGKGPMIIKEISDISNEASLPKPTQVGRIETCTELIRQATKCLKNNDKECVLRKIEELVRADCHNGYAVGREAADEVRDVVHELWLVSDNELRCELLKMLRNFGISKGWVKKAAHTSSQYLDKCLARCGINWESGVARGNIVKMIEGLLRERFGWSESKMCESLLYYIGIDVETLRKHGINPCDWIYMQTDDVYFMGIALSDLSIEVKNNRVKTLLGTSNAIDAVFFSLLLQYVREPSILIAWAKGGRIIEVTYFITVRADKWGWTNREELIKRIKALRLEDMPRLIAGAVDGDGSLGYNFTKSVPFIEITACKTCEKRVFLNALQEALRKLGIESRIYETDHGAKLGFYGKKAIKLLRLITPHLRHPLKRLRAKLILMLHEGKIDDETFTELYEQTEYEDENDPKRGHAVEALARAAPQTHTHGASRTSPSNVLGIGLGNTILTAGRYIKS